MLDNSVNTSKDRYVVVSDFFQPAQKLLRNDFDMAIMALTCFWPIKVDGKSVAGLQHNVIMGRSTLAIIFSWETPQAIIILDYVRMRNVFPYTSLLLHARLIPSSRVAGMAD